MSTSQDRAARWRHDLKNQLGIVMGFSEVLLTELEAGNPHQRDVEEIRKAAGRALELLASLEPADEDEVT